jgi:hypothetical protein
MIAFALSSEQVKLSGMTPEERIAYEREKDDERVARAMEKETEAAEKTVSADAKEAGVNAEKEAKETAADKDNGATVPTATETSSEAGNATEANLNDNKEAPVLSEILNNYDGNEFALKGLAIHGTINVDVTGTEWLLDNGDSLFSCLYNGAYSNFSDVRLFYFYFPDNELHPEGTKQYYHEVDDANNTVNLWYDQEDKVYLKQDPHVTLAFTEISEDKLAFTAKTHWLPQNQIVKDGTYTATRVPH